MLPYELNGSLHDKYDVILDVFLIQPCFLTLLFFFLLLRFPPRTVTIGGSPSWVRGRYRMLIPPLSTVGWCTPTRLITSGSGTPNWTAVISWSTSTTAGVGQITRSPRYQWKPRCRCGGLDKCVRTDYCFKERRGNRT